MALAKSWVTILSILLVEDELPDFGGHEVEFFGGHAGEDADPEGVVHEAVGVGEGGGDAVVAAWPEGFEAGMAGEVAREEVSGLDAVRLQVRDDGVAGEGRVVVEGDEEAEPGGLAFGEGAHEMQVGEALELAEEAVEVVAACAGEVGEAVELGAADGGLHFGGLEVEAEVAVDVFVVVVVTVFR